MSHRTIVCIYEAIKAVLALAAAVLFVLWMHGI